MHPLEHTFLLEVPNRALELKKGAEQEFKPFFISTAVTLRGERAHLEKEDSVSLTEHA